MFFNFSIISYIMGTIVKPPKKVNSFIMVTTKTPQPVEKTFKIS